MTLNSLARSAIHSSLPLKGQIDAAMRGLRTTLADVGGASSPEMKAAGNALARGIRKTLSVQGALVQTTAFRKSGHKTRIRGLPSAPGEPPHKITASLVKSVGVEVVGGVMRVGEAKFTSRLLEEGVNASETRRQRVARQRETVRARRARAGAARRKARLGIIGSSLSQLHIAPRPFMQRGADLALPKMGDDFVLTLQKRIDGGEAAVP